MVKSHAILRLGDRRAIGLLTDIVNEVAVGHLLGDHVAVDTFGAADIESVFSRLDIDFLTIH